MNVEKELAALRKLTVDGLRTKFADVFGEPTRSRHKEYLVKRIIWRMQANAEGGLSERALARARELANDADLRVTAPRQPKISADAPARTVVVGTTVRPSTDLLPGTMLRREYKGRTIRVNVLTDGFEHEGERYKSLTAVTKAVTGKHWNGFHFSAFGTKEVTDEPQEKEKPAAKPVIRCAIYTRKSTEEGLEQEFNTLDAQRDAGEAYIKSQQHEGWVCLPARYDDGGFTGANMERPALRRLLADIEAGKIDCVVVYKVDRLSRSLLDFGKIVETFERHKVSFVSVTQAFNTATSMGRLILNVLLSFAQFEREMISERTRDKIAATRRKGKWSGGMPVLGYNVVETKLVVDEGEAQSVREIFDMYLEQQSLLAVAKKLDSRGSRTKRWTTRKGTARGGRQFDKGSLYHLLTNVAYLGQVRYKTEVHRGEHTAIIDAAVFERVQKLLLQNGQSGGRGVRNKHGALLRGLLRCAACNCGMSHSFSGKGPRQYRYYVCNRAQKCGWQACPAPSVPAGEMEQFVIDQIRCIGRDPMVLKETLAEARRQAEGQIDRLKAERTALVGQLRADHAELVKLVGARPDDPRLAEVNERIGDAERRLSEIGIELATLEGNLVDEGEVAAALADFNAVWDCLAPHEQARVVELLVEQVVYDHERGVVAIAFRETGIKTLAAELAVREEAA